MPYIGDEQRPRLNGWIYPHMATAGELNYMITKLCDRHITHHGLSYQTVNELIGVLECAKLELYRRIAAPYEDIKIAQNGDVYLNNNNSNRSNK